MKPILRFLIILGLFLGISNMSLGQTNDKETVRYGTGPGLVPADVAPSYPGGQRAWTKYLKKTLKYPKQAQQKGIQGPVFLVFLVKTDGSITNIREIRSPDESLTKEAIRVVKLSKAWNPAKVGKKKVPFMALIQIEFKLK